MGLYKGEQLIAGVAGGLSNIDNITITENANEEIQTVAVKNQNATANNAIKTWTGTQAEFDAITTKDPTTLYNVTDTDPSYSVNTQYKNIGAIVQSMVPLTDAGLHLLDGSLIQMGVYSEFVEYMANLYGDGTNIPSYFCTETEWQASVAYYGICGKFVYDSVNNTVRLPKVIGIIEGTTDASALGDLVEAGLPQHHHLIHTEIESGSCVYGYTGFGGSDNTGAGRDMNTEYCYAGDVFDNPIYGNSTTVQPQTIKCFVYIVIANSTKTGIQVDIDEIATDLNGKADTDLTNLNDQGKNIAKWASNITNCVTEIPQDIKLELVNNVLTLKAGSKIYYPDGFEQDGTTLKFNEVVTTTDQVVSGNFGYERKHLVLVNSSGVPTWIPEQSICYVGPTAPTEYQYEMWWDTANNVIKWSNNTGSSWSVTGASLPICMVHYDGVSYDNGIQGVDAIFNGFGFMGPAVFVLPGVKYKIPNGKNADGTLINKDCMTTRIALTYRTDYAISQVIFLAKNGDIGYQNYYKEGYTLPNSPVAYTIFYNIEENKVYRYTTNAWEQQDWIFITQMGYGLNIDINEWQPKLPARIMDYSDRANISGWGMPSGNYITLTLGASGTQYTAPSDGYYAGWTSSSTTAGAYFALQVGSVNDGYASEVYRESGYNFQCPILLPVKKGTVVTAQYTVGLSMFRFYPVVGSEREEN